LIYAVGPGADGDRMTPMRPSHSLSRFMLAAIAMLAAGFSSGVMAIWLVLAPIIPTGAAGEQMRQPFPPYIGQTTPDQRGEPTAVITDQSSLTPPTAEQQGPVSQGADGTSAIVDQRPDEMPELMAPALSRADQRLRCAHNAASVR
jgi:hypothetical protein